MYKKYKKQTSILKDGSKKIKRSNSKVQFSPYVHRQASKKHNSKLFQCMNSFISDNSEDEQDENPQQIQPLQFDQTSESLSKGGKYTTPLVTGSLTGGTIISSFQEYTEDIENQVADSLSKHSKGAKDKKENSNMSNSPSILKDSRKTYKRSNSKVTFSDIQTDEKKPKKSKNERLKSKLPKRLLKSYLKIKKQTHLLKNIRSRHKRKHDDHLIYKLLKQNDKIDKIQTLDQFKNLMRQLRGQDTLNYTMSTKSTEQKIYKPTDKVEKIKLTNQFIIIYPLFIVSCENPYKIFWDLFIMILVVINSVFFPIFMCFYDGDYDNVIVTYFDYFSLICFWVDILLNFRTTFLNEDYDEIVSSRKIAQNYMSQYYFYIDILAAIPFSQLAESMFENIKLIKGIKIIRILRLSKLKHFQSAGVLKVSKIIFYILGVLIIIHWCTCYWYLFAINYYYEQDFPSYINSWLPTSIRTIGGGPIMNKDMEINFNYAKWFYEDLSFGEKYIFSLYSMVLLCFHCDISPINQDQITFAILITIGCSIMMGVVFGNITVLMGNINESTLAYKQNLEQLTSNLIENSISGDLSKKSLEYYEYTWLRVKNNTINNFQNLSLSLQKEIIFETHRDFIIKCPLFMQLEHFEIFSIIQKLRMKVYMPEQHIFKKGEIALEMMFLTEGTAEQIHQRENKKFTFQIKKGEYFGELALFSPSESSRRRVNMVAVEYCFIDVLRRKDVDELLTEFPHLNEKLYKGLIKYKMTHPKLINLLFLQNPIFEEFEEDEIKYLIDNYFSEIFIEPFQIVVTPKKDCNAFYFVFSGNLRAFRSTNYNEEYMKHFRKYYSKTKEEQKQLNMVHKKFKTCYGKDKNGKYLKSLDRNINQYIQKQPFIPIDFSTNQLNNKCKESDQKSFICGDAFGSLKFGKFNINNYFVISETACQLGYITTQTLDGMMIDDYDLYNKLQRSFKRVSTFKKIAKAYTGIFKTTKYNLNMIDPIKEIFSKKIKVEEQKKIKQQKEKKRKRHQLNSHLKQQLVFMNEKINFLERNIYDMKKELMTDSCVTFGLPSVKDKEKFVLSLESLKEEDEEKEFSSFNHTHSSKKSISSQKVNDNDEKLINKKRTIPMNKRSSSLQFKDSQEKYSIYVKKELPAISFLNDSQNSESQSTLEMCQTNLDRYHELSEKSIQTFEVITKLTTKDTKEKRKSQQKYSQQNEEFSPQSMVGGENMINIPKQSIYFDKEKSNIDQQLDTFKVNEIHIRTGTKNIFYQSEIKLRNIENSNKSYEKLKNKNQNQISTNTISMFQSPYQQYRPKKKAENLQTYVSRQLKRGQTLNIEKMNEMYQQKKI